MEINELLKLNPNSECELKFTFTEEWKHCYYQLKNKSSPELDPNNLPVLDEEYSGDTGEPLLNDNDEEVFDPTQEIKYELYYEIEQSDTYKSKTFIGSSSNDPSLLFEQYKRKNEMIKIENLFIINFLKYFEHYSMNHHYKLHLDHF